MFTWRLTVIVGLALAAGCRGPRINTTEITVDDVRRMTDEMAQSFLKQSAIRKRKAASPKWVFSLNKVRNLTMHVIEPREQWRTMARLRALLTKSRGLSTKNIAFVLPPEEWLEYGGDNALADPMYRATPTHSLQATFRSDTSQTIERRSDTYLCAFQLIHLESGEIIWEDAYEVKYVVAKNRFD